MNVPVESLRVGQLDVLRAIACMCVLVAHCDSVYGLPTLPSELGAVGVAIFFTLSGYLITGGLLRHAGLASFYLKRSTRILPPYMLMLAVMLPFWWDIRLLWCATFSFNLLYVSGVRDYFHVQQVNEMAPPIGHLWSLCVEEHYYWFWPLILGLLNRKAAQFLLLAIVLATPFMAAWIMATMDSRGANPDVVSGVLSRFTLTQLTGVAIGSWVALLDQRWLSAGRTGWFRLAPIQWVGVGLVVCAIGLKDDQVVELVAWLYGDMQYVQTIEPTRIHFWGAGLALVGMACSSISRLKRWQYVGRISYGLYLYHLPIYAWFGLATTGKSQTWLTALLAMMTTFAVAAISFHFLEQPCIQWGRRQAALLDDRPSSIRNSTHRNLPGVMWGIAASLSLLLVCGCSIWHYRAAPPLCYLFRQVPIIPLEQRRHHLNPVGTAAAAYRWLGVDHYADSVGFRRTTPFPVPRANVLRILTVGDSYTWGACVHETQTYSALLDKQLRRAGMQAEVINCGKAGGQAEDVLMTIRDQLLDLKPQRIIYAATLTDFLPANHGLDNHTFDEWYWPENEQRFVTAVQQMHALCRANDIELMTFVFHQNPSDQHLTAIARHIEQLLKRSAVPVVSIEEYLEQNANRDFRVYAPVDDHPNAHCHGLIADLLSQAITTKRY